MRYLYRIALLIGLLLSLVALCLCVVYGLQGGIELLMAWGGMDNKMELLRPKLENDWGEGFVYLFLLASIFLLLVALWKEKVVLGYLKQFVGYWSLAFRNLFNSLTTFEIWFVVALPFIASIVFAHIIPVSYDEAITYNLFTSKPFYYCMIFYPYPNNHVLHSLFTNIAEYIPWIDILFSIRIPAILSSLLAWLIGYSFLKKYYSSSIALLAVGLASAMYMSIYYSFMSRGYAFMVLAFVVCMYAAFNIIKKGSRNKDWMFFIVAAILGCYTIPSFLYPFATLNALILFYNYKNIKQQIVGNIIAGVSVLLLYMPIILVDGLSTLTSNQFVAPISRMDILNGIYSFTVVMLADIAGVHYYALFVVLLALAYTIYKKDKWHLSLFALFLLAPAVLLILHSVNPFYRTFLYYNFILVFLIVVPFKKLWQKIPKAGIIVFVLVIQLIGICNFKSQIGEKEGFNTYAAEVCDTYFEESNKILFPTISSANYEFEAKVRGMEERIIFVNALEVDVDTLDFSRYDYIILSNNRDKTQQMKPYDVIGKQHIYKKEK